MHLRAFYGRLTDVTYYYDTNLLESLKTYGKKSGKRILWLG